MQYRCVTNSGEPKNEQQKKPKSGECGMALK